MSSNQDGKERRRFQRITLSVSVRYAPRQFGSNVPPDLWEGQTMDVSRSGGALEMPHRLRLGGIVELTLIQVNPPRCVNVVGEVVRCKRIPGASATGTDGTPGAPLYLVAVQFTRVLDMEELAVLRESRPLDVTQVEQKDQT